MSVMTLRPRSYSPFSAASAFLCGLCSENTPDNHSTTGRKPFVFMHRGGPTAHWVCVEEPVQR
jgi:hypothetical protein